MILTCYHWWNYSRFRLWKRLKNYLRCIIVELAADSRFVILQIHLFLILAASRLKRSPQLRSPTVNDDIEPTRLGPVYIATLIMSALVDRVNDLTFFASLCKIIQLVGMMVWCHIMWGMILWRHSLRVDIGFLDIEFKVRRPQRLNFIH